MELLTILKIKLKNGTVDVGLLKEPVDISKYEFVRLGQKEKWGVIMRKIVRLRKKNILLQRFSRSALIFAKRESVRNEK